MLSAQRGVTLVELMIATTIGLFAISVVLTVYATTARHSSLHLQRAHLHQQLHAALQLVADDVRRSGYWGFDPHVASPAHNPFQPLRIDAYPGEPAGSCLLLAYDADADGLLGVGRCAASGCAPGTDSDNMEQFGFRLRAGAVQSRYGGDAFACDSGFWQAITDPEVEITRLAFVPHPDCINLLDWKAACSDTAPRLLRDAIELHIAGRQRRRPDIALELSSWVRVRNDRLVEASP